MMFFKDDGQTWAGAPIVVQALVAFSLTILTGCSSDAIISRRIPVAEGTMNGVAAGIYHLPEMRVQIQLQQTDAIASCAVRVVDVEGEKGKTREIIPETKRTPSAIRRQFSLVQGDTEAVPDRTASYVLDYDESAWSSDKLTVDFTSEGLLDKVYLKAEDTRDKIVLKVGEAAKEARKVFIPYGRAVDDALAEAVDEPCASFAFEEQEGVIIMERTFDPQNDDSIREANAQIEATISAHSPDSERGLPVFVDRPRGALTLAIDPPPLDENTAPETCGRGICYRPVEPFDLVIKDDDIELDRTILLLPTKHRTAQIDVSRATFVEKITKIDFENGVLKQVDIDKPSEALAIVSLPVDILKAIVAIPAELIQLKIDTTKDDQGLIDANKQLIDSQRQLLEAQKKLLEKERELTEEEGMSDTEEF